MPQPLIAGPRFGAGILSTDVTATMAFDGDVRVTWGVEALDAAGNVQDVELPVDVDAGGSVRWSYRVPDRVTGGGANAAATRRTASVTLSGDIGGLNLFSVRLRIWSEFLSRTSGKAIRWHHGVFVTTDPGIDDDGQVIRRNLELADKSFLWNQKVSEAADFVLDGTDVLALVRGELETVFGEVGNGVAGTIIPLAEPMLIPAGTSYAERWRRLLEAVGFDAVYADEDGLPRTRAFDEIANLGPFQTYGPADQGHKRIVVPGRMEPLNPSTPNVLRFVARKAPPLAEIGNGWAERRNENTGPASLAQRRYEVFRSVPVEASNQTELEAVADADSQRHFAGGGDRFVGQVALDPRLSDQDVVSLVRPRLGVAGGSWICTDWEYPLARMTSASSALQKVTLERRVVLS